MAWVSGFLASLTYLISLYPGYGRRNPPISAASSSMRRGSGAHAGPSAVWGASSRNHFEVIMIALDAN